MRTLIWFNGLNLVIFQTLMFHKPNLFGLFWICVSALMVNKFWPNRLVIIDVKNLVVFGIVTGVETHCGQTAVAGFSLISNHSHTC